MAEIELSLRAQGQQRLEDLNRLLVVVVEQHDVSWADGVQHELGDYLARLLLALSPLATFEGPVDQAVSRPQSRCEGLQIELTSGRAKQPSFDASNTLDLIPTPLDLGEVLADRVRTVSVVVEMRVGMIADVVAASVDLLHELRFFLGLFADQEKHGSGIVLRQQAQDLRRVLGVRSIIESEQNARAVLGEAEVHEAVVDQVLDRSSSLLLYQSVHLNRCEL